MRAIFRLALAEWFASKVWIVFLVLFVAGIVVAPMAVPTALDPSMAAPAINQVIYGLVFLLCAFHAPMFAAEIGRAQITRSQRTFWRARGIDDFGYYVTMTAVAAVPVIFISIAGFVFMRVFGSGSLTTASLAQAMILTAVAFIIPLPLCIGLSQKGGASFAFAMTVLAEIAGFYAPAWLEFIRQKSDLSEAGRVLTELLLTIIPQLRIGDQAERVTFAWEPIAAIHFSQALGYFGICLVALGGLGFVLFRRSRT